MTPGYSSTMAVSPFWRYMEYQRRSMVKGELLDFCLDAENLRCIFKQWGSPWEGKVSADGEKWWRCSEVGTRERKQLGRGVKGVQGTWRRVSGELWSNVGSLCKSLKTCWFLSWVTWTATSAFWAEWWYNLTLSKKITLAVVWRIVLSEKSQKLVNHWEAL